MDCTFSIPITQKVEGYTFFQRSYHQGQGSGVQVEKSGPSCIYVAIAGNKSAVGHFPQSEEQPICYQLVCFISAALKLLSTPNYITLGGNKKFEESSNFSFCT